MNKTKDEKETEFLEADILVIGGGTAGCLASIEAKEKNPNLSIIIMEKAHIDRSGCLAAGMNAINAYINPGETSESFVKYVRNDAMGLVREDLIKSAAEEINSVVKKVESWGLPVKKNKNGEYLPRGRWNIQINGESLKPIIAEKARSAGAKVLNRVAATNLIVKNGKVFGAFGLGVRDMKLYVIKAAATIICTGGASGIYKPNNDGSAHHKMWYPPFNTGAGYAMGIRAGAEMTSFEMRFIALRTKDVISPTGTLALGFGAKQVNAKGEQFMKTRYSVFGGESAPTCVRVYGPTIENKEGRGPCYMDTKHLKDDEVKALKSSYLDMYPGIVLYWAANGIDPGKEPIEICGTEPYITGGHCQAGYWIDVNRHTTLPGLYAAGDVAGGYPYKFVSGCWAEGILAARGAVEYVKTQKEIQYNFDKEVKDEKNRVFFPFDRFSKEGEGITPGEMEERLQKIMDEYAGGIRTYYEINEEKLNVARKHLVRMKKQIKYLIAKDSHELMRAHEIIDQIEVASVLVEHLSYRKETRWPGYTTRLDYPHKDDAAWLKFVNSAKDIKTGEIKIIERPYKQIIRQE